MFRVRPSYIKEFEFDQFARGITYWDFTQKPIFENGKMKYIFETAVDVTERVLENQSLEKQNMIIERQNKQLKKQNTQLISIIENLSEGVMFADNEGKFIMINPEAKRLIYQSDKIITLGNALKNISVFDMKGNEIPFENFPSVRALKGETVTNVKFFIRHPNKKSILWKLAQFQFIMRLEI